MSMETDGGMPGVSGVRSDYARAGGNFLRTPGAKFFFIGLLSFALTVPMVMVLALTSDREARRDEVAASVGQEWGGPQTVIGPVLVIPYLLRIAGNDDEERPATVLRHLAILPDTFSATINATAEERNISIYGVPVFSSAVKAEGRFPAIAPQSFGSDAMTIQWDKAYIAVSIADLSGVEEAGISIAGRPHEFEPGLSADGAYVGHNGSVIPVSSGVNVLLGGAGPIAAFDYTLNLRVRGTGSMTVAPVGRQSEIAMRSDWAHPNFAVGMLPSERTVSAEGFTASWRVPYLARTTPQTWVIEREGAFYSGGAMLGAGFVSPIDLYALVERALKYGVMFIGLTFLTVFVLEVLSPSRIHIVQYCLVGLVLVMFFVLLLALAEQTGFGIAYLAASTATTAVVSIFVGTALHSRARALLSAGSFAVTFGLLYAILRLEDLALLSGAVAGFVIVTVILFATRKVDWSGFGNRAVAAQT